MVSSSIRPWLVAVTAIVVAILFCGYLRLLIHLCTISASRISAPRQRLSAINEATDLSLQLQNLGLEVSAIDTLPAARFTETIVGETTDCAVCLAEFKEGEPLRKLPSCGHSFHVSCIDAWFLSHSSCPLCRSEVQKRIEVSISVSGQPLLQSGVTEEQPRILSSGNRQESENGN